MQVDAIFAFRSDDKIQCCKTKQEMVLNTMEKNALNNFNYTYAENRSSLTMQFNETDIVMAIKQWMVYSRCLQRIFVS